MAYNSLYLNLFSYRTFTYYNVLFSFIQHHSYMNALCSSTIVTYAWDRTQAATPGAEGQIGQALFLSGKCACLHTQNIQLSKQEPRQCLFVSHETKHCPNVKICPAPVKGGEKLGETVRNSSSFVNSSAKRLGARRPTTIKGEAKSKPRWLPLVIDQSSSIYYKYQTRRPLGSSHISG